MIPIALRFLTPGFACAVLACGDGVAPEAAFPPADSPTLEVVRVSPERGAVGIARAASVTVSFSEPVDGTTLHAGSFSLWTGATQVSATVTGSGNNATLVPSALLELGTTYSVVLTEDVAGVSGLRLGGRFASTFTTKPGTSP